MDQILEWIAHLPVELQQALLQTSAVETISLFQKIVQWVSIAVSALAGAYEARRRDLDLFGVLVIAFVVSVGGGTLRDVLLNRMPLFWVTTPVYVVTVVALAALALLAMRQRPHARVVDPVLSPVRMMMRTDELPLWVVALDALGLGLFAYVGTSFAMLEGVSRVVAPVFGIMTASFGGLIRDMLFAEMPSVLKRGQLYALCAAAGSAVYVLLLLLEFGDTVGFLACTVVAFGLRMASVRYNIRTF
jgi:uncharacterized membrane protein YeiH